MKINRMILVLVCILTLTLSGCSAYQNNSLSSETDATSGTEQVDATSRSNHTPETGNSNNENSSTNKTTAGADPTSQKGSDKTSGEQKTSSTPASHNSGSSAGSKVTDSTSTPGTSQSKPSGSFKPSGGGSPSGGQTSSSSRPPTTPPVTEPEVPADLKPYIYPFNVAAIKADLIRYGQSLGMAHTVNHPDGTVRTPENCSWWDPYTLSKDCVNPAMTRRQLYEMVEYDYNKWNLQDFTIYIDSSSNGRYNVYMMH